MTTTIITATYNKPEYLREAAQSVFAQTDADWEWWIILDGACHKTRDCVYGLAWLSPKIRVFDEPTTEQQRRAKYRPAVIANRYYPMVQTPYMAWLSDDDLLSPLFLEALVGHLRQNPDHNVAYGICEQVRLGPDGESEHCLTLPRGGLVEFGPKRMPAKKIDGGQVVHTSRAYQSLAGWQVPDEWNSQTDYCDGLFLNELAKRYQFHAVPETVLTHRCTPLSEHNQGQRK